MPTIFALFAPLALLVAPFGGAPGAEGTSANQARPPEGKFEPGAMSPAPAWIEPMTVNSPDIAQQVRVEGRVILRVAPRPPQTHRFYLDDLNPNEPELVERPFKKCIAFEDIRGASDRAGRLMLFIKGGRVLIAGLEKGCLARDFYRGFYVEKNQDGMMCAGRDRLLSRSGAKCELKRMTELVEATELR